MTIGLVLNAQQDGFHKWQDTTAGERIPKQMSQYQLSLNPIISLISRAKRFTPPSVKNVSTKMIACPTVTVENSLIIIKVLI